MMLGSGEGGCAQEHIIKVREVRHRGGVVLPICPPLNLVLEQFLNFAKFGWQLGSQNTEEISIT